MTFFQKLRIIFNNKKDDLSKLKYLEWKPVPGFEDAYEMNVRGIVRSKNARYYHKVLPHKISGGYPAVKLSKNGVESTQFLHRLLALAYIPNPECKAEVNHKNGIKNDYRLENLEWATHQENVLHAYQSGLASRQGQMKKVVNNCSGKAYKNAKEAAEAESINYSTLKTYLNGTRRNPTCLRYAA
jgi:hypothetical protein